MRDKNNFNVVPRLFMKRHVPFVGIHFCPLSLNNQGIKKKRKKKSLSTVNPESYNLNIKLNVIAFATRDIKFVARGPSVYQNSPRYTTPLEIVFSIIHANRIFRG